MATRILTVVSREEADRTIEKDKDTTDTIGVVTGRGTIALEDEKTIAAESVPQPSIISLLTSDITEEIPISTSNGSGRGGSSTPSATTTTGTTGRDPDEDVTYEIPDSSVDGPSSSYLVNTDVYGGTGRTGQSIPDSDTGNTGRIEQVIPDSSISKVSPAAVIPQEPELRFDGFEFNIGLDNVRLGRSEYKSRGIYASVPLTVQQLGEVGLRTIESRPYLEDGIVYYTTSTSELSDSTYFLASIEYYVLQEDYQQDSLVKSSLYPILPLGQVRINHERLILTETFGTIVDTGTLCFYATLTDSNIKVYRNGSLLDNTLWSLDQTTTINRTPNQGQRMMTKIRILGQLPGDIFTVSYTPVRSTTLYVPDPPYVSLESLSGLHVVDMTGDLMATMHTTNLVSIHRWEQKVIDKSLIYLMILLRQNTSITTCTSIVEEYILFGGQSLSSKLEVI